MEELIDDGIKLVEEKNKLPISKKITFIITFLNCFLTGIIIARYDITIYSVIMTFVNTIICYNAIRIIEINKCSSYINGRLDAYEELINLKDKIKTQ